MKIRSCRLNNIRSTDTYWHHTILVIVYHMLKNQQPYRDLGSDYFDRRNPEQLKRSLIRRLEGLGLQVSVKSANPPEEG